VGIFLSVVFFSLDSLSVAPQSISVRRLRVNYPRCIFVTFNEFPTGQASATDTYISLGIRRQLDARLMRYCRPNRFPVGPGVAPFESCGKTVNFRNRCLRPHYLFTCPCTVCGSNGFFFFFARKPMDDTRCAFCVRTTPTILSESTAHRICLSSVFLALVSAVPRTEDPVHRKYSI
jgi:hypothetical protein